MLYIVAWLLFLGKTGPVNQALSALFGAGQYVNVNSLGGMIFVEGMMWSPLAFHGRLAALTMANCWLSKWG